MRIRALALAFALVALAACSKINEENFNKVRDGMSEQEVLALLGTPTESSSINVLGISGTASKWVAKDAVITVQFVNAKVRGKSFDRPPIK
jgi:SmpA/OmlA family protein